MKPVFIIEGLTVAEFVAIGGSTRSAALSWLARNGYRRADGVITRGRGGTEIEDDISRRIASCPPTFPCARCGARVCAHQKAMAA